MPTVLSTDLGGAVRRPEAALLDEQMFLRHALSDLTNLQREAEVYYHGVLARILSSARMETELLLREAGQAEDWPQSAEEPSRKIR